MNIGIVILVLCLIIIFGIIGKLIKNTSEEEADNDLINHENPMSDNGKYIDFEELYFSELKNGQKPCKLTCIYDQLDLMFIKSLFQAEGIPYFIENEHSSTLHPAAQISSLTIPNVNILEKDYETAIKLIQEYKQNKDMIEKTQ